jgi:predicted dehydrogenase
MAATMMLTFAQAGVRVTAVASHDPDRARRFAKAHGIPTATSDLLSLLHRTEVDAIYIANGPVDHAATTIAALEAGKPVLCEKPLALSADEAERVIHTAQQTGKLCMEGIWTPFLPAYRRFFDLARAKHCGEPAHLHADFGYPVAEDAFPRLFSPAAGGVLLDRGVYLVALALQVFGPVERVQAQLDFSSRGVESQASLQLSHSGGGQSQLSASFSTLMANNATLACSEGNIRLEEPLIGSEAVSIRHSSAERASSQETTFPLGVKKKLAYTLRRNPRLRRLRRALPSARREHLSYGHDQYLPQLEHFLGLMKSGARESSVVSLELSMAIQRVIGQARAPRQLASRSPGPHEGSQE